ncbi:MAG: PD-(D/E)XK nuclease family protein, partial [Candidatus Eremiobacteraeota bacterium]|nr:PD-(D/E)XK nuclease family protein [Candidatus Eremiobacteraeota bacterium]
MTDVLASPELPAFVIAALRWAQELADERARELITNPYSGVPNEIANALVTIAHREGTLMNAISHERLALPANERVIVLNFSQKLGALARAYRTHGTTGTELLQTIETEFALPSLQILKPADSAKHIEELISEIERCSAVPEEGCEQGIVLRLKEEATSEATLPLRTRHSHFSASSLNTYVDCKRKWFYRYMCAAVEDRGSSASFFGSAFHAALEGLHTEFPRPGEVPQATLRSKLDGYLNAAFDRYRRGFDTSIEFELQRRRARRTAQRYLAWLSARAARSPFTVIGCELSALLDLEGFE